MMSSISSKTKALTCPRKAYISELSSHIVSSNVFKYRELNKVYKSVLKSALSLRGNLAQKIYTEFSILDSDMLAFEAKAEMRNMYDNINRYLKWELEINTKLITTDVLGKVDFAGSTYDVCIDALFDRGNYYEAVTYSYNKPKLKNRGRLLETDPKKSLILGLMSIVANEKVKQLLVMTGIPQKPVLSSVYYAKSFFDKFDNNLGKFNEKNDQIVSHMFTHDDISSLDLLFRNINIDKDITCDKSKCDKCMYRDLCEIEFVPKKKIQPEKEELTPINNIKLTTSQEEFIFFVKGECRVNAVAGSGKTTIIVLRTIYLLELDYLPEEIVMMTFTEKAAKEMRDRIKRYIKGQVFDNLNVDIDNITISTFNSWGQSLLEENYDKLGFSDKPRVIDDVEKKDIIVGLLKKYNNLPLRYNEPFLDTVSAMGAVTEICKLVDTMKSVHVETETDILNIERLDIKFIPFVKTLLSLYDEYNSLLKERNLIDFEDQLRLLLELKKYGVFANLKCKHIIIDEFQDSNPNQIDLIRQLMESNSGIESLAVVGDEMQAIYGFRNASPENLIDFQKYFPNMKDFYLEDNFRSQSPIINMANKILEQESRLKAVIKANKDTSNVEPELVVKDDQQDEYCFISKKVQEWINSGIDPSTISVLGKTRSELRAYEKTLNKEGIPTIMRVPEILRESPYVKAVLSFALWLKTGDFVSFALYAKMMGEDFYNLDNIKQCMEKIKDLFDKAEDDESKKGLFFDCILSAREDYLGDFFIDELEDRGFKNLKQIVNYCVKYVRYGVVEQYSTTHEASDCVSLITVHSSKGLEYDNCILSIRKFKEESEDKRLLYVGVTRAKERLIVVYPSNNGLVRLLR